MVDRRRVRSGSPFEATIGFSRAVRIGDRVVVSGTGPVWSDGSCQPDAAGQAARCFEIIDAALDDAGLSRNDVVRTRKFIVDRADGEAVGRVHARFFADIAPAATMVVVSGFLDPRWRVEVEAEAVVGNGRSAGGKGGAAAPDLAVDDS